MPKIIENLEQRLLEEAGRQLQQTGYGAMTVRSVAAACGVGVGTVYNYFPSKDALLAAFMLEDWHVCMRSIEQCACAAEQCDVVLRCIYNQLTAFLQLHSSVFRDREAASHFGKAMGDYHGLLREQLAKPLRSFCADDFTAAFAAEALIAWTVQQVPFAQLLPVLQKLF